MSENRNRNGTPTAGATLTLDWDWPARPVELKAKVLEFLRSNPAARSVHWITVIIHYEAHEHESKVTHRMTELKVHRAPVASRHDRYARSALVDGLWPHLPHSDGSVEVTIARTARTSWGLSLRELALDVAHSISCL